MGSRAPSLSLLAAVLLSSALNINGQAYYYGSTTTDYSNGNSSNGTSSSGSSGNRTNVYVQLENTYNSYYGEFTGNVKISFDSGMTFAYAEYLNNSIQGQNIGNVICRLQGYGPLRSVSRTTVYSWGLHAVASLNNLWCAGNESRLEDCVGRFSLSYPPYNYYYYGFSNALQIDCQASRCLYSYQRCSQVCYHNPVNLNEPCGCWNGYQLDGPNSTNCIDIDECAANYGGCEYDCVNTVGSYRCTCPSYMTETGDGRTCKAPGFSVVCKSDEMVASFSKDYYPMLAIEAVTLADEKCLPHFNLTHIIFTTKYSDCGTIRSGSGPLMNYKNTVINKRGSVSNATVRFTGAVNISFTCAFGSSGQSDVSLSTLPVTIITIASSQGPSNIRLRTCIELNCSRATGNARFVQGSMVYADLEITTQDFDLSFAVRRCTARSSLTGGSSRIDLIVNGAPAATWVKILDRSGNPTYRFQFPAFTFMDLNQAVVLECQTTLMTSKSPPLWPEVASAPPPTAVPTATTPKVSAPSARPEISSCSDAASNGQYLLRLKNTTFNVWCDITSENGPWITVMRRNNGALKFNQSWQAYEEGFGSPSGEFWLGNKYLHALTDGQDMTLRIEITTFSGASAYAQYDSVAVSDSYSAYRLMLGGYSGTAGDMLNTSGCSTNASYYSTSYRGEFSTNDRFGRHYTTRNCSDRGGGWWGYDCGCTCLTCGPSYSKQTVTNNGMIYYQFSQYRVLKSAQMKFRIGRGNSVYQNSRTVSGASITCNLTHMVVKVNSTAFGDSYNPWLFKTKSLVYQEIINGANVLTFTLTGLDTVRQENLTTITYIKSLSAQTLFPKGYYSGIQLTAICSFHKAATVTSTYPVANKNLMLQNTEIAQHGIKLMIYKDEQFRTLHSGSSGLAEGQKIFIEVVPETANKDFKLGIISCVMRSAGSSLETYSLISYGCPSMSNVEILARDRFSLKLFTPQVGGRGINISCGVQACAATSSCDVICGAMMNRTANFNGTAVNASSFILN